MRTSFELKSANGYKIIVDREQVRVGRASDNNVVMKDSKVSRYHVNFYLSNGNLVVEDAGSQNGFLVNGTPGTGAMILKTGDKLFFGSYEYVVSKQGETFSAAQAMPQSARINIDVTPQYSATPKNNPRKLLLYLVVAGLGLFILKTEYLDKQNNATLPAEPLDMIESPLALDTPGSKHVTKSLSEVTAEGKFKEGMRDYYNGNYTQAKLSFDEAFTINPSQTEAQEYLLKTNTAIQQKVDSLIKDATKSYSTLQYQRARAEAFEALAVITEELPGWSRKLASEEGNELKDERKEGQEEILLTFQCDKTERKKACEDAIKIIKSCRQKLGVEDAIR